MAKTSNAEWELSKENIQPLQHGRKHGVLKVALTMQADDVILQQRQAFEHELRTYSGNDPLSVWCKYIKWVEQNFPKGGRGGHIEKLLQKCLFILKDEKQYLNDHRFIEIWLKFAVVTAKPSDAYDYMYSNNIGCQSANFYIAWAWELEQKGDVRKANQVLTEGLQRKAEPIEKMKSNYSEFKMRIVSKELANPGQNWDLSENGRSAFSILKPQNKKNMAPVMRVGEAVCESNQTSLIVGRQQPVPRNSTSSAKAPFKIYNAENIAPSLPVKSESATPFMLYSDHRKENETKPCKWKKARVKQTNICPSAGEVKPDFNLHHDETPQPSFPPRSVPKVSDVLKERQECQNPPMALFEPSDPKRKSMYDKNKIYGGAEELSLEEIRAAAWYKNSKTQEKEKQIAEKERLVLERQNKIKNLQEEVKLLKKEQCNIANKPPVLLELKDTEKSVTKISDGIAVISDHPSISNGGQPKSLVSLESKSIEKLITKVPENAVISDHPSTSNGQLKSVSLESKSIEKLVTKMLNGNAVISNHPSISNGQPKSLVSLESKSAEKFTKMPNGNAVIYNHPSISNKRQSSTVPKSLVPFESDTEKSTRKHCHTESSLSNFSDNVKSTCSKKQLDPIVLKPVIPSDTKGIEKESTKMAIVNSFLPKLSDNIESNCALNKSVLQTELTSNVKLTTFNEAEHMVRELYDGTFFNPTEKIENSECFQYKENRLLSQKVAENAKYLPFSDDQIQNRNLDNSILHPYPVEPCLLTTNEQKKPFTFYHDQTKNISKSNLFEVQNPPSSQQQLTNFCPSNQENVFLDEDRENIPPIGYVQEVVNRELSGVLEPSKDIPYIPLELQEELEEQDVDEDLEDEYIYNNRPLQDETIIPPCNTEVFLAAAFLHPTSTPRTQVKKHKKLNFPVETAEDQNHNPPQLKEMSNDNCNIVPLQATLEGTADDKQICKMSSKMKDQSILVPFQGQLSMIMESSRENYKSSSSSGSSSGVTQLSQFYGQDKSNIDPFNEEIKKNVLQSLHLSPDLAGQIKISNKCIRDLKENSDIEVGNFTYIIENKISETSYGKVYAVMGTPFDQKLPSHVKMGIKVCNSPYDWEFYICTMLQKRLEEINAPSYLFQSVMNVTAGERYANSLVLAFELSQLGTLEDFVNQYKRQASTVPEMIVMYLTSEMLQVVSKLHECKIIHGDVKPDNIFLCHDILKIDVSNCFAEKKAIIKFVEFNQAIDLKVFKKGICFKKDMHNNCIEMMENKPWVFQPDWYGLLNCVHLLLFSESMKVKKNVDGRWGIEKRFKRFWDQTVWGPLFDELLNIPSCYQEPDVEKYTSKIDSKLKQDVKKFQIQMKQLSKLYPQSN